MKDREKIKRYTGTQCSDIGLYCYDTDVRNIELDYAKLKKQLEEAVELLMGCQSTMDFVMENFISYKVPDQNLRVKDFLATIEKGE